MMAVHLAGVGILAPGLTGWEAAKRVLTGADAYVPAPLANPTPEVLPPAERRRAGPVVRLALAVAQEALRASGLASTEVASVFASSDGDGENVHIICEGLAANALEISPTRFHNSVQNAPSGYWSIATGCHAPSNTVSGFDTIFAEGLLEAAVLCVAERIPVILVVYDLPMPPPLFALRSIAVGCGIALTLTPDRSRPEDVTLELSLARPSASSTMSEPALEALRNANPVARGLPLLEAIARHRNTTVMMGYDEFQALGITVHAER